MARKKKLEVEIVQPPMLQLDERIGLDTYDGVIKHLEMLMVSYVTRSISGEEVKVLKELLTATRQTVSDKQKYGSKILNPEMQAEGVGAMVVTARGPFGIPFGGAH